MKDTKSLDKFYSSCSYNKFVDLTRPVADYLGIDTVVYTVVNSDGSLFQVSNYPELSEFYWDTNFYQANPFFKHPKCINSGTLILPEHIDDKFHSSQNALKRFYRSDCILAMFTKSEERATWVALSAKNHKVPLPYIFMNERALLEKYMKHLIKEWSQYKTEHERYAINILQLLGNAFYSPSATQKSALNPKAKLDFLKKIGEAPPVLATCFTKRELECLRYLAKGKTAPEIAKLLYLSSRTVESHIARIKDKLNCSRKSQIVEAALELHDLSLLLDT